jgi:protein-S-isoprenylcysteine O-methyltransferase Ste14
MVAELLRHPAGAAARGTAAILGAYFLVSAVLEERTMAKLFPAAYPPYKRATYMLIPYIL